jgi:diacylglycerol kinase
VAAALLGGSLTAATHFSKAGARAAANTSPEPFSNLALSFTEDAAVVAGSWLAVQHPEVFLVLLAIFLVLIAVLMSWLIRGFRRLFRPAARPTEIR